MRVILRTHSPLFFQLIRFGIIGSLATLMHFTTVVLLVEFTRLHPLSANVIGFSSGFVFSFSGHRFWTFSGTTQLVRTSLPRFFLVAIINFIGNQTLYYTFLMNFHWNYTVALILVLGIMASVTFLMGKLWVFR